MSRYRSWCWTLNNYTQEEEERIQACECKYIIYGREVGESGTPHLQGYIYWSTLKSMQQVKAAISQRAHVEVCKGTGDENIAYCSKDGDIFTAGTPPANEAKRKRDQELVWDGYWESAKAGRFEEIPSGIQFRYYSTIRRIHKDYGAPPTDLLEPCGIWMWGPPGVGKSWKVRHENPGAFTKLGNKWWDGYQGEETVILDDFDDKLVCLGRHIKIWSDAYSFPAEIKGGVLQIRPKRFIVTSNYSIEHLFRDDPVLAQAIRRRFVVTECPLRMY